jgi:tellurite resistance protein TerC
MSRELLLWALFWAIFLIVSAVDYYVTSHRKEGVTVKQALRWTGLWIGIALAFGAAIHFLHPRGAELSGPYIAGYLTEYSLSIDNLFVFILIFSVMNVAPEAQPKLIKLGIYLSIALRLLFILFGIALLHYFHWLIYGFGALLVWTAWKMVSADEDAQVDPKHNLLYRLASRFFTIHDAGPGDHRLFINDGTRTHVTPLFLVFLVIGSTDVLFAVDSIPAIMGISQDPFVVVTSNIFAVLGLNSLFFAIRGIMGYFKFLKHGVSVILFFIGAKMIACVSGRVEDWFKDHSFVSLLVIGCVLAASILLSIWHDGREGKQAGTPGSGE